MENKERMFTLNELSGLVNMPRRTVRYYVQIGLIDRPLGSGRGAHYNIRHLDQLLDIRKWQDAGLSLSRIRELLSAGDGKGELVPLPRLSEKGSVEVWSRLVIGDGVELNINPQRAKLTPEQTREFASEVTEIFEKLCLEKEK